MKEIRQTAVVMLIVLCVGCSAMLHHTIDDSSPTIPLLDYRPDVYLAPGVAQNYIISIST